MRRSTPSRGTSRRLRPRVGGLLLAVLLMAGCTGEETAKADDVAMSAIDRFIAANPVDKSNPRWRTRLPKPPKVEFDPARTYTWKLVTNQGEMRFELLDDVAPMHASSTLYLTRLGFYDGGGFHRVIKGFMAQGGCPLGNGRGDPGYRYTGEFDPKVVHDAPGLLSMANAGPGTDGSQFFITFRDTRALDGRHTIFGRAADEATLATIRKIEALGRPQDPAPPLEPIVIERATILID